MAQRYFRLCVIDSGCGIKEELKVKLFQLFSFLKFKDSVNQNGIGLGLTMCKKIVDAFGGFILCKSTEGEGTKFKVDIPVTIP
jgi:signal transduction histidine kinase